MNYSLKYGNKSLEINIQNKNPIDLITPHPTREFPPNNKDIDFTSLYEVVKNKATPVSELTIGIAINDKTRPVPYPKLIPPLIKELITIGVQQNNINFFIANGTHVPDHDLSYLNLSDDFTKNYNYIQHDCDKDLIYLGRSSLGTEIFINQNYYRSDIKISIGNVEPHHFAGYSGGAKTVAIGLAGKETITHNHSLLIDENSVACEYHNNKVRQDIEEIGIRVGIDLSLNCIQTKDLQIIDLFFDSPHKVMRKAMPIIDEINTVSIEKQYDFLIASAGGFPKDINFYQAQKATSNASKFLKRNGVLFLLAECKEGPGSDSYFNYVRKFKSPADIIEDFNLSKFTIGHHKAYLMAKTQMKNQVFLYSNMSESIVKSLLINPVINPTQFINDYLLSKEFTSIAIMPDAVTTIPITKK